WIVSLERGTAGQRDLLQRRCDLLRASAGCSQDGEEKQGRSHRFLLGQNRARATAASVNPGSGYWNRSCWVRSSSRFFASRSSQNVPATRAPAPAFSVSCAGRYAVSKLLRGIDEVAFAS